MTVNPEFADAAPRPPEFPTPKDALIGPAMLGKMEEHLTGFCAVQGKDPAVIPRILERATEWAATIAPGVPVLMFEITDYGVVLHEGGWVCSELYLNPFSFAPTDWDLQFYFKNLDSEGRPTPKSYLRTLSSLAWTYRAPHTPPTIIAGEANVRQYLAGFGRRLAEPSTSDDETNNKTMPLVKLYNAAIPPDYLGLSEEARTSLCNELFESALYSPHPHRQPEAFRALRYLADIHTPEETRILLDAMCDQWASMLPLAGNDGEAGVVVACRQFTDHFEQGVPVLPDDDVPPQSMVHAHLMHQLYMRRALQEPIQAPEDTTHGLLPELHELRPLYLFAKDQPSGSEVREDVTYLRQLKVLSCPLYAIAAPAEFEKYVRRATDQIFEAMSMSGDAAFCDQAFEALEYLLAAHSEAQRAQFYELVMERLARYIPLGKNRNIAASTPPVAAFTPLAAAIGRRTPEPPTTPHGVPLHGSALVAGVMAEIYLKRTLQLRGQYLRSYKPTGENEESTAQSEEVI